MTTLFPWLRHIRRLLGGWTRRSMVRGQRRSYPALEILEDRTVPSAPGVSYTVTNNWGSGLQAQIQLTNNQNTNLSNWQLQFTDPDNITSIWDAQIVSHVGNTYIIQGENYDNTIPAGGSVSFGFVASVAANSTGPSNFVLTGSSSSGGTSGGSSGSGGSGTGGGNSGGNTQNPTAANYTIGTSPGQPIEIDVLANDTDPLGYTLTVTSFGQGKDGKVTQNADGSLSYTPAAGFTGTDAFTYSISDGMGGTATGTVQVSVAAAAALPNSFFAPYVDMGLWPTYTLTSAMQAGGVKDFTLAFIVADSNNQPAWGGYTSYEVNNGAFDTQIKQQIAQVRNAGGNVMVSFGGADGEELAQAIINVQALTAAYQSVIDAYNLSAIDFDIEGAALGDPASIDRRSQAIAAL